MSIKESKKSAVVVGGSNGIGLAVSRILAEQGRHVYILDKSKPDMELTESFSYVHCNLLDYDEAVIKSLAANQELDTLFISAGFGRASDFEYLHSSEIESLFKVNSIAALKIIREFYGRIKSREKFFCGIMGSIAGLVSSPMFSVYAATKAAVCRFTESVNIELEAGGFSNRILNVSPGAIKGTRFHSGKNQPELLDGLAHNIVDAVFASEELFIPDYEDIYKGVIERYKTDAHAFGLSSYQYKKEKSQNEKKAVIGYMSGTFDLFHIGHLSIIKKAKEQCDYLIVGVHSNVRHKKRETFISYEERLAIVESVRYVDKAVEACQEDSDAWELHHYNKLFVGSDYKGTERFAKYEKFFEDKGVEIVFFPYTKSTSSTQLRSAITARISAG